MVEKNEKFCLFFFMLGYRGTHSEISNRQFLTLYKPCFSAHHTNFWFGFCKNTEKLPHNKSSDLH